jgi:hypothetical protein
MIKDEVILGMVRNAMKFPGSQICTHLVASNLLSELENSGYPVTEDFKALAHAVVFAWNDVAVKLVDKILKKA